MDQEKVKKNVRESYGKIAGERTGCGSCCSGTEGFAKASFCLKTALFRNLCVSLRNFLCGVRRVRLRAIPCLS